METINLTENELLVFTPKRERLLSRPVFEGLALIGLLTWGVLVSPQVSKRSSLEDQAEVSDSSQNIQKKFKKSPAYFARIQQAKELMGNTYSSSLVSRTEKVHRLNSFVHRIVRRKLKGQWKRQADRVARQILLESRKYGFDPLFLMAVIQNESSFKPTVVGPVGEIGLMQLRPSTGKWMAQKISLPWRGKSTLRDPVMNIRLGAAFLHYLRKRFDHHGRLYLAAYNMGARNVKQALRRNIWPKIYPSRVMRHYLDFYSKLDPKQS